MTYLTPNLFIEELKSWKLTSSALFKVRVMESANFFFFKFHIPNSSEILETAIRKEDYTFYALELNSVSVPAVWEIQQRILEELKPGE